MTTLVLGVRNTLHWTTAPCADRYNVYRFTGSSLVDSDSDGLADGYGSCFAADLPSPSTSDPSQPPLAQMHAYLATAENAIGEGSMGTNALGVERPNTQPCP